ncbi:SDR family NAD(P)-dependent oxidoreductase [Reinekea sp.]|jgi:NAD(P)-dependent dehydrogenase (short-subunit alcohol dehydrogenase family)|uniref:SDR family NAD(P)-dependent oxidoreductase n=1 Tax=Reinekea sp. TaxID=1970455 RepID=UPI002A8298BD|nr:SDR family oxidoreductase [Reinekea sp.]
MNIERFTGQVCIVTGAAQGIGLATARRLASEGAQVFALDISEPTEIVEGVRWIRCDVTSQQQWQASVAGVVAEAGPVDVLVNNAGGVGSYDELADISTADWDRVIMLNQSSVFYGMQAVLPSMIARSTGSIVNVSSMWGIIGTAGVAAYQASKGAVTMMTKNAAATYASRGVRVNSVHPGFIWTPMTVAQDADISQGLVEKTPMARAGLTSEVAASIAFLASQDASFVTGVQLLVDGGFTTV